MTSYTIENELQDSLITIALGLTIFPYVVMLALGALGHRLDIPFLSKFGFFEALLLSIAAYPLRNPGFGKKVVKPKG